MSREEIHFKVGFLQPNTNELQRHVDFNFIIIKDGKEVFRASNQTGQPNIPLHSIPGTMDIPLFTENIQLKFLCLEFCLTQGLDIRMLDYKYMLLKYGFTAWKYRSLNL